MKKKAIEKIPFLKLDKISKKKDVKYIGVTAIKIVDHEKHLFLEVYRNQKAKKDVPAVRIVLTKKDFGTYFPEKKQWSRGNIKTDQYYNGPLIWSNPEDRGSVLELEKQNVLRSEEDMERIKKFCKPVWNNDRWWQQIETYQGDITSAERRKRESRRYERRKKALEDRITHTRILPEKKILKRADDIYLHNKHYLYYKKRGSRAEIACSSCGGVTDARWKGGISYESQFEKYVAEPREGHIGICPMCGAHGEYKCQGKVKGSHRQTIHLFLGQKYKDNGLVMRYIEVSKTWNLQCLESGTKTVMYNASEELSGVEIARAYYEEGKKKQIDYHKHNPYTGTDFWDDCNLSGMNNITIKEAPIMFETYQEMQETIFKYSALEEYAKEESVNPINYLERYMQTPQMEMLVKLKLFGIAKQLINCECGIIANENANCPDEFLGIRKERVKWLCESRGNIGLLQTMKMEKRMNQNWTEEQIENLHETGLSQGDIETATRYMSIQQLLNRIKRYAGCEYGTGCTGAIATIKGTADTYKDYLNMRIQRGYDLNNTIYQYPRDLRAAHEQMVMESHKEEMDKRFREVAEKFPNIKHIYRELRKKYYYEDDDYIIRPARAAEEIVMEGRLLHHCVGGDGYLRKHNNRETYILMLRFKQKPKEPYITVEIDSGRPYIKQWYGKRDTKPDKENIDAWLDNYLEFLKFETIPKTA